MSKSLPPETIAAIRKLLLRRFALSATGDRKTLSDWAEKEFELDADSSHKTGAWECWSFQRGIMDWASDDRIVRLIVRKSKRVGYTKIITALVCYYAVHLRRKVAMWQPTDDDRDSYCRTELEPLLDKIKALRQARRKGGALDTIRLKQFLGAVVHMLGGKAARAFRRITVALSILDEWSAFDQSVEGQGDPGSLAFGRLEGAPYPKFVGGSTPGTKGACHVTLAAEQADVDMRYHVECPHCGVEHPLTTGIAADGKRTAHGLQWEPGKPETAVHICPHCREPMTRAQYLAGGQPMLGTWVCIRTGIRYAGNNVWTDALGNEIRPPRNVAAQVWSAYSPQRAWSDIADDHEKAAAAAAQGDYSLMITLVNETYGEAYEQRGARVDEHALSLRADKHPRGTVPKGALVLTSGIDVQQDRVEIGVWGWGPGMESWAIDHHIIEGNPSADEQLWATVETYLQRRYTQAWHGGSLGVSSVSIDSGYATHAVYAAVRRMIAASLPARVIKGRDDPKMPVKGPATAQDVNWQGRKWANGIKLWNIGTQASEDLLHGQLGIEAPGRGYIHMGDGFEPEWYAQLTGKQRLPVRSDRGIIDRWVRMRPRVEVRDCRRYAHHAAVCLGLEAWSERKWVEVREAVQPAADLFAMAEGDPIVVGTSVVMTPAKPTEPNQQPRAITPAARTVANLRANFNRW